MSQHMAMSAPSHHACSIEAAALPQMPTHCICTTPYHTSSVYTPHHPSPPQVLNYGQSIFEGMKAQRSAQGRVVLFRPDKNAERFAAGAARMSMPAVPEDMFVEAVKSVVEVRLVGGLQAWLSDVCPISKHACRVCTVASTAPARMHAWISHALSQATAHAWIHRHVRSWVAP